MHNILAVAKPVALVASALGVAVSFFLPPAVRQGVAHVFAGGLGVVLVARTCMILAKLHR